MCIVSLDDHKFLGIFFAMLILVSCKGDTITNPPQPPTLQSVSPNTANRGVRDLKLELTGTGFQSDFSVGFGGGIEVTSKQFVDATHISVTVTVARTAAPGPRVITLTQGTQSDCVRLP